VKRLKVKSKKCVCAGELQGGAVCEVRGQVGGSLFTFEINGGGSGGGGSGGGSDG
jgi:hypothetical protein